MRYVEENPVRAGMVVNPGAYRRSSYRANALGKAGFDYDWHYRIRSMKSWVEALKSAGKPTGACFARR